MSTFEFLAYSFMLACFTGIVVGIGVYALRSIVRYILRRGVTAVADLPSVKENDYDF